MRNIKELTFEELEKVVVEELKEKKFRAKQIWEWLWKKNVQSIDQMTTLSVSNREKLAENYNILPLTIQDKSESKLDKTTKYVFVTNDNFLVEGVLIPSHTGDRVTSCISTQVGCPLKCSFCATGTLGFKRNLTKSEIYEQVFLLNQESEQKFGRKLTNIVVMGMGEPLLNLDNLLLSLELVSSNEGLGISPSRITVSTVGLVEQLKILADYNPKFNLAISLHSAIDSTRTKIMPINKSNNIENLIEALKYYHLKTNQRITFEYLMINGINDKTEDSKALANFCKNFPSKVNLIEFNPVEHIDYKCSKSDNIKAFYDFLESKNMVVTIRRSKGQDIEAACGQLALKKSKK